MLFQKFNKKISIKIWYVKKGKEYLSAFSTDAQKKKFAILPLWITTLSLHLHKICEFLIIL